MIPLVPFPVDGFLGLMLYESGTANDGKLAIISAIGWGIMGVMLLLTYLPPYSAGIKDWTLGIFSVFVLIASFLVFGQWVWLFMLFFAFLTVLSLWAREIISGFRK